MSSKASDPLEKIEVVEDAEIGDLTRVVAKTNEDFSHAPHGH